MTERISKLLELFIKQKAHHAARQQSYDPYALSEAFAARALPDFERACCRIEYVLGREKPAVFEGERIVITRTMTAVPELFTKEEAAELAKSHWIHERGEVCNISVDYTMLLNTGFDAALARLAAKKAEFAQSGKSSKAAYIDSVMRSLYAVISLAERYEKACLEAGNEEAAGALKNIAHKAPGSFYEALQLFRLIHFAMWCGGNYHNTVGRFDQYMLPYLKKDMDAGLLDYDGALELLEEFFISFNKDSDLYPGMQQGDNGQSMVLGGKNPDGSDAYNILSELCLKAELELKLIDPKLNLRVHSGTPLEIYELATQLTRQGLGFPQYSNDDVVIPALINMGYSEADAYNYVVAACWEFIIPGRAMDIPNIAALPLALAVRETAVEKLASCASYEEFETAVFSAISEKADVICEQVKNVYIYPSPLLSLMCEGCVEKGQDISLGCAYNNYGVHGTGIATAVDSLAAIKKYVYDTDTVSPEALVAAMESNFESDEQLGTLLRYEGPKFGTGDKTADAVACRLLDAFADAFAGKRNDRGGIFRAGTGTAMYYLWHSNELGATPDGRKKGEGLPANYSPSLFVRCSGPVSIIRAFTKPELKRVCNGGPLTLELHDTVFRGPEAIQKVALLVRSFIQLGGHQLQLNAVDRDKLLDAQKHPENYRNLIVRVWGWSGYFVELDKEYQDHIIKRAELCV